MTPTLLVADDSPTIQRVLDLTFAAEGIKVIAVSDGQQAVDYLRTSRPDAALISVSLQKLDGFDVARFVRSQPALDGLPVLLMAGAFDTIEENRVRAAGAAGILFKPFEPGHVINRVKHLFGRQSPEPVSLSSYAAEPAPAEPPKVADTTAFHLDEEWFTDATSAPGPAGVPGATGAGSTSAAGGATASYEAPEAPLGVAAAVPLAPFAPVGPVAPQGFGPADAFAVLLAEEQGETVGPLYPEPAVELSDAMVERIADRVADRLMQGVFGDSLRGAVHDVSERLVREEIQRIRAAHTQGR